MLTDNSIKSNIEKLTGYKTIKQARNDSRYIKSFMTHGNAKLMDYIPARHGNRNGNEIALFNHDTRSYKYAQFNLRAVITCPFATTDCKKFCYAKRDERYPNVINNRNNSMTASRKDSFINDMVYTISVNLLSKRYANNVMVIRIHESGEFYNQEYLNKWIDIIGHFADNKNVIFQFYTKAFDYILSLDTERAKILKTALARHVVGLSLSSDMSTKPIERVKIERIKAMYPNVNEYRALLATDMENATYNHICDCAHCAKCGHCTTTTGEINIVEIH